MHLCHEWMMQFACCRILWTGHTSTCPQMRSWLSLGKAGSLLIVACWQSISVKLHRHVATKKRSSNKDIHWIHLNPLSCSRFLDISCFWTSFQIFSPFFTHSLQHAASSCSMVRRRVGCCSQGCDQHNFRRVHQASDGVISANSLQLCGQSRSACGL